MLWFDFNDQIFQFVGHISVSVSLLLSKYRDKSNSGLIIDYIKCLFNIDQCSYNSINTLKIHLLRPNNLARCSAYFDFGCYIYIVI